MTNNPTIDGVSREQLKKWRRDLDACQRVIWLAGGFDPAYCTDAQECIAQMDSVLDAPAVERQEPEVDDEKWWADTPDGDSALVTRVGALTEWQKGRDAMRDERDAALNEVAALQSTIARLEARVAELESGRLAVWYGAMPESNGKTNWTAILHRKGDPIYDGCCITLDRSEYPDRVRYEADRVRYLIGELGQEPFILDYDANKHSGYTSPPAPVAVDERAAFEDYYADYVGIDVASVRSWRKGDGYSNSYERCQISWEVWQARACLDATAALNGPKP